MASPRGGKNNTSLPSTYTPLRTVRTVRSTYTRTPYFPHYVLPSCGTVPTKPLARVACPSTLLRPKSRCSTSSLSPVNRSLSRSTPEPRNEQHKDVICGVDTLGTPGLDITRNLSCSVCFALHFARPLPSIQKIHSWTADTRSSSTTTLVTRPIHWQEARTGYRRRHFCSCRHLRQARYLSSIIGQNG